jgi:hypothetical protein
VLPRLVEEVIERAPERCTVTDVGSTKDWSLRLPRTVRRRPPGLRPRGARPAHATADLFDGATWFLTPTRRPIPERYRLVHGFVASLGAVPVGDRPAGARPAGRVTSHLPTPSRTCSSTRPGGRIEGHDPLGRGRAARSAT